MQIHQQLVDEFQIVANIFCCRLPLRVASLFFHDDVMAVLAITFSGGIDIVFVSLLLSGWKPKNDQLGAERKRRPELIASNHFRKYAYNTFV